MTDTHTSPVTTGASTSTLKVTRLYTTPGVHPYDEITWERRDVVQTNWKTGETVFEQRGVEFPAFWSENASTIVTTKYFRGALGTEQREWSLRQVVDRVVDTYTAAAARNGYLRDPQDLETFDHELKFMLVNQVFSFNSPVWFNIGTESPAQASACFILAVDDTMDSILNWYREEGLIFKGGSGAGLNLSRIRSSKEILKSSGGTASGPVSFMRGADASAGTIKSGGATRRAAKMVVLDVDHPDIEEFIDTKMREEDKIRVLRDAGFDMDLGGRDITSVQYQNANNSVRVSDEFMRAVENGGEFLLRARTTDQTWPVDAKALFRKMAEAAWACADPGIQYDDTINHWHTNPETGRITASNPCFTGDTLVQTSEGALPIDLLVKRFDAGDEFVIPAYDEERGIPVQARVTRAWMTRMTDRLVTVATSSGETISCTPDHRFLTPTGWVPAESLTAGTPLVTSGPQRVTVNSVEPVHLAEPVPVYDLTVEAVHTFFVGGNPADAVVVHNCSEFMSLDNSSCNLASLNLMKFKKADGSFDVDRFTRAVEFVITAMEVSISFADFPTESITQVTRDYRQLGIGFANLGALLMSSGLAYDSPEGRAYAAAITALMTATAYRRSAEIAGITGPYAGYARNAEPHTRVMRQHADAAALLLDSVNGGDLAFVGDGIVAPFGPAAEIAHAATRQWDTGLQVGAENGWRNAQISLLAPTGTIGFMMDCDTTGIEPDFSLVKFKKLVGGGSMQIVNSQVRPALTTLGYPSETIEAIEGHIVEHGHVIDAPGLSREHYPVFDCAVGERAITAMGHIRMMAAVQPALSGAISKTVNLPQTATVEEIEDVYFQGWKLGLKAIAVYRDNCKVGQPLSDAKAKAADADADAPVEQVVERVVEKIVETPVRKRLPKTRSAQTVSFKVGEVEGYLTAGQYDDGHLGEMFLKVSKQGSTLAGIMDAFSIAVSLGLQYGVPLEAFVAKFVNLRFEPAGFTDDPDVRMAQSMLDYIFRRLALDYLPYDARSAYGIYTTAERTAALNGGGYGSVDEPEPDQAGVAPEPTRDVVVEVAKAITTAAPDESNPAPAPGPATVTLKIEKPLCIPCGTSQFMVSTGACWACTQCGSTSGCS